ncbi:MAG: hypothetical protein ACT4QC_06800 [Planctomycetaceae bacterium]
MSKHRLKCMNSQCAYVGMMDATSDAPFVKQHFLDKQSAKRKRDGATAAPERMQVRCPKCGARWRLRSDQLH